MPQAGQEAAIFARVWKRDLFLADSFFHTEGCGIRTSLIQIFRNKRLVWIFHPLSIRHMYVEFRVVLQTPEFR